MDAEPATPTPRTEIKRRAARGSYDETTLFAILDAAFVCHVGFIVDGVPVVIPTAYGRVGSTLYLHGSPASRMLRTIKRGVEVCVTVTLVDGLVLARSAFHHSLNYRSVVLFGVATEVNDLTAKAEALRCFVDHVVPGRSNDVRGADEHELRSTTVLALPIDEASAKVRTGPPIDEDRDMDLAVWAGVLPISAKAGEPIPDPMLDDALAVPANVAGWSR